MSADYHSDPAGLDYSAANIRSIARCALLYDCSREGVIEFLSPNLFSDLGSGNLLGDKAPVINAQIKELDRIGFFDDLSGLHHKATLTSEEQFANFVLKQTYLLHLLSGKSQDECKGLLDKVTAGEAQSLSCTPENFADLQLLLEKFLRRRYQLDKIFNDGEEQRLIQDRIWHILTTPDLSALTFADHQFWCRVLSSIDGVIVVKQLIDQPPQDAMRIKLQNLLWIPNGADTNLYREFAADVSCAQWLGGYHLQTMLTDANTEFRQYSLKFLDTAASPLNGCLVQLENSDRLLQREHEYLLFKPGALFYSLFENRKEARWEPLIHAVQSALGAQAHLGLDEQRRRRWIMIDSAWHKYDNLMQVLMKLAFATDDETRVLARSFIDERLKQQAEMGLWDLYWQTACCIKVYQPDFAIDWEQLAVNSNMLASLCCESGFNAFISLLPERAVGLAKLHEILQRPDCTTQRQQFITFLAKQQYADPQLIAPWRNEIATLREQSRVVAEIVAASIKLNRSCARLFVAGETSVACRGGASHPRPKLA